MNVTIGGYLVMPRKGRTQLQVLQNPDSAALDERLQEYAKGLPGVLVARLDPLPKFGPYKLRLYAEEFNYLLMLEEYSGNGDCLVRTLRASAADTFKTIFGEPYPAAAITTDFLLVCQMFKEFVERHDVSKEMMSE
ncbi:DUF6911 family protein [Achromobacter ruhlandii]|uniref:DUF6911 family protein n=1 Tax=Achromobacter ruhlandii TaxID=72557 RepID=UPI001EECF79D|nr:hypothetical protein [Achromobacter ruhlandii]